MIRLSRSGGLAAAAVLILSMATTARAQEGGAVITGRVTSDAGVPLPGANVLIQELNVSVGTSAEGRFSIPIPAARVNGQTVQLRARSVGFTPTARPVGMTRTCDATRAFSAVTDMMSLGLKGTVILQPTKWRHARARPCCSAT